MPLENIEQGEVIVRARKNTSASSRVICPSVVALIASLVGARLAAAETTVDRGEYLVNAVMACDGCHTPRGPDGKIRHGEAIFRWIANLGRTDFLGEGRQHHARPHHWDRCLERRRTRAYSDRRRSPRPCALQWRTPRAANRFPSIRS